jgi:adenylosuccinate lyase
MPDQLNALSPLDGRYANETKALQEYFSEFAIIRGRVAAEVAYLAALSKEAGLMRPLTSAETDQLQTLAQQLSIQDAQESKNLERITRHDVKAVESFLRARLANTSLSDLVEYLHFGLTSEDVNNIAQAIALRDARERVLLPAIDSILKQAEQTVRAHKATPMLGRTHGQPAVPTTFGKEMAVFLTRLKKQRKALAQHRFEAKLNGAVGNFNALAAAAPQVDWRGFSERFIRSLNLEPALVTTQILPYDNWVQYFHALMQINSILIGLAQDMWQYASHGYLRVKAQESEVGSSTMPQKVNPIDFENAEGNFGIANALLEHFARKLPISRLQRDLSDSTVRRTFGTALGHALVGYSSLSRGLGLIDVDKHTMKADLEAHWEVVAEGAQTILRAAGVDNPYELLKALTRGKGLTEGAYKEWIDELKVDETVKAKLRWLSPLNYTGLAEQITDAALKDRLA